MKKLIGYIIFAVCTLTVVLFPLGILALVVFSMDDEDFQTAYDEKAYYDSEDVMEL